jgi:hypothetical protein
VKRSRPLLLVLLAVLTAATMASARTDLAAGASWQFAPASAPPPPPGTPPASDAVPVGQVGEISFWSPNRGLLISEGTGGCATTSETAVVPCGLYAYNGEGWHLLSTVCGSADGRIAWAGPDEFWTISDQRPGQVTTSGGEPQDVSLCHFLDGKVVGSYATPFNQPNSYLRMDAAACLSPSNCWFGGRLGKAPNKGAFHLHWNGQTVTAVYSPENHAITSMALADQGTLLESVQIGAGAEYESESAAHPAVIHQIDPPGSSIDFHNLFIPNQACESLEICPPLPDYGTDTKVDPVAPDTLAGFSLGSDYTPSGSNTNPPQLWAAAGPDTTVPSSSSKEGVAHPIVLRYSQGAWTQVVGNDEPGGDDPFSSEQVQAVPGELFTGVAAEPGTPAAWLAVSSSDDEAHVDRVTATGTISAREKLGAAQGVGQLGTSGPIACPAANDCWLATSKGWLFHLTEDPEHPGRAVGYPVDTDQNFAELITFRPADEGVPQLPGLEPPPEESLNQEPQPPPIPKVQTPTMLTRKPLVTDVSSRVVRRYTLELSFRLTVKARVQLLASRRRRRVAQTPVKTLKAGKHTLMLRLNPHSWPNKLNLKAIPLEALPTVESKGGAGGGGSAVPPPIGENTVGT